MPADAPDAFDGGAAGESFDGGAREGFDGANEVFLDGRDGERGAGVDNDVAEFLYVGEG